MIAQLTQPLNCWRTAVAHLLHRPTLTHPATSGLGPLGGPRPLPLANLETPLPAFVAT
jgi:hypothetical protein